MLKSLPDEVPVNSPLAKSFYRMCPLTVEKFQEVADEYGLTKPVLDDEDTIFRKVLNAQGFFYEGQMNKNTNQMAGVIRKCSCKGDSLSELVMFGRKNIGLSRHFDITGCVAYVITDNDGRLAESKFFDENGKQVQAYAPCIKFNFLKRISKKD